MDNPTIQHPDAPLLTVQDLTLDLVGDQPQPGLVEGVSFAVPSRGSVALIGESGCGKTLTAMAILGLLPKAVRVSRGTVRFDGDDLLGMTERQLRRVRGGQIGAVFQDPMSSLDPTMKVGDQIAESRRLHRGESLKTARRTARELLDRVGIPNAAQRVDAYPYELSGGMQQRVMIAAAIACDCRLLVADEPTTALDVTIQAEILELLRELQRDLEMAVLLVTHDLGVVADFCDDVVVMYAGHVVERCSLETLSQSRQHPYTEALLAAVPTPDQARSLLEAIPGRVPSAGEFPDGCRFAPRCRHALAECSAPQPEVETSSAHFTRCGRAASGSLELVGAQ